MEQRPGYGCGNAEDGASIRLKNLDGGICPAACVFRLTDDDDEAYVIITEIGFLVPFEADELQFRNCINSARRTSSCYRCLTKLHMQI